MVDQVNKTLGLKKVNENQSSIFGNGTQKVDQNMTMNGSIFNMKGSSANSASNENNSMASIFSKVFSSNKNTDANATTNPFNQNGQKASVGDLVNSAKTHTTNKSDNGNSVDSKHGLQTGKNATGKAKSSTEDCKEYSSDAQGMTSQENTDNQTINSKGKADLNKLKTDNKTMQKLNKESKADAKEMQDLQAQKAELTGESDKSDGTGSGKTSAFYLALPGSQDAKPATESSTTSSKSKASSTQDAQAANPEDQAKVEKLDAKIEKLAGKQTVTSQKIKTTTQAAKTDAQKIQALVSDALTHTTTNSASASTETQGSGVAEKLGQATTVTGSGITATGLVLEALPDPTGAHKILGAKLITAGTATTAAGGVLTGAAQAAKGDLVGASASIQQTTNSAMALKAALDAQKNQGSQGATPAANPLKKVQQTDGTK